MTPPPDIDARPLTPDEQALMARLQTLPVCSEPTDARKRAARVYYARHKERINAEKRAKRAVR